jgi:hypothetical protein
MDVQTRLEDFGLSGEWPIGFRCRYCGRSFGTEKGLNSHITKSHLGKDVPLTETLYTYNRVEVEEGPGKRVVLKIHTDKAMLRELLNKATKFGYPLDIFIFKVLYMATAPTLDEMEQFAAEMARTTGHHYFSPITGTLYEGGTGRPIKMPKESPEEVGAYIS